MLELLQQSIARIPGIEGHGPLVTNAIAMAAICLIAIVTFYVFKYGLIRLITKLITKTKSSLDDVLLDKRYLTVWPICSQLTCSTDLRR